MPAPESAGLRLRASVRSNKVRPAWRQTSQHTANSGREGCVRKNNLQPSISVSGVRHTLIRIIPPDVRADGWPDDRVSGIDRARHPDRCFTSAVPGGVQQTDGKSENFLGFSSTSRSLPLMTWEIAFGELAALYIPLTGS